MILSMASPQNNNIFHTNLWNLNPENALIVPLSLKLVKFLTRSHFRLHWFHFYRNFFVFQSSKGVFDQFPNFLSSATKDNPLIIILDSLDQLSPLHGAWKLIWFPRQLPLHVKFIVSTLPDQDYKCFPILKVSLSGNWSIIRMSN